MQNQIAFSRNFRESRSHFLSCSLFFCRNRHIIIIHTFQNINVGTHWASRITVANDLENREGEAGNRGHQRVFRRSLSGLLKYVRYAISVSGLRLRGKTHLKNKGAIKMSGASKSGTNKSDFFGYFKVSDAFFAASTNLTSYMTFSFS